MRPLPEEKDEEVYELTVRLPSRDRLLADLTSTLSALELDVLDGEIVTDADGRAHDRLRVRAAGDGGVLGGGRGGHGQSPTALAARVRQKLQDALEATMLRPGDAVLLDEHTTLKRSPGRSETATPAGSGQSTSSSVWGAPHPALAEADAAPEPLVGCLDMRTAGLALALLDSQLGALWRRFVLCLAPALIAPSAWALWSAAAAESDGGGGGGGGTGNGGGNAGLGAAAAAAALHQLRCAADAREKLLVGGGRRWLATLRAFELYQLREAAGHADDGLQLAQLRLGPELGSGSYGSVCLARDALSGRLYAVKRFRKAALATPTGRSLLNYLERERDVLRLLSTSDRGDKYQSRWLIHLVTSGQTARELCVVMPACLGGELWHLLNSVGALRDNELQFYAACLVLALSRLHELGIVYRDLKPENVLLHADGWPVLADVGLAAFVHDERPLFSLCGTPEYMAPEVVAHSRGYGAAADWWSLGVLLSQCLTLTTPFQDPQGRPKQTFDNVFAGRVTAPPTAHYRFHAAAATADFLDALLDRDTGRRLGGDAIRLHPFFWGLDWAALRARRVRPPHAEHAAERAREVRAAFAAAEVEAEARGGFPLATAEQLEHRQDEHMPQGWENLPGW